MLLEVPGNAGPAAFQERHKCLGPIKEGKVKKCEIVAVQAEPR